MFTMLALRPHTPMVRLRPSELRVVLLLAGVAGSVIPFT